MKRLLLAAASVAATLLCAQAEAAPTVEYLGTAGAGSPGGTTQQITIAANVAAGDTVELFAGYGANSATQFTSTDSKSQAWTCRTSWINSSTSAKATLCRKTNSVAMSSGVDTITVTFPGSAAAQGFAAWVIHGANTVDQFSSGAGVSAAGPLTSSASPTGSTAITTTQAPNATVAGLWINSSRNVTAVTSGWSQDTLQLYGTFRLEVEHKTNAGTATETYNPTISASGGSWASGVEDLYSVPSSPTAHSLMMMGIGN